MSLLNKIRNKPYQEKVRLVWIIAITAGVVMLIAWLIFGSIKKNTPKDLRLFETIGNSVNNLTEEIQNRKNQTQSK